MYTYVFQKWRRRWFVLQQGKLPRQYVLNYYVDDSKKRLKGTIPLDDCQQVRQIYTKWVKIPKKGQFLAAFKCLVLQLTYAKYSKFESNFEFWI